MQDVRQSQIYAKYMQRIGWMVEDSDGVKIFIKKFPLLGSVIKIQRADQLLSVKLLDQLAKKYNARSISLELNQESGIMNYGFKINKNPYLPTKTIRIDLEASEEKIFQRFSEAKRRAVRKAIKNGVIVKESHNIEEFVKVKSKDFWPLGFFMAKDVKILWESFRPENVSVVIGYYNDEPVAGILLLFYDGMAYYWMAASTGEGKKLFAPTLLVWEALKLAKKKKCKIFDFEGIYDERFHDATKRWQGFTKFKEGFGGKEIIFPEPLIKHYKAF